MCEVCIRHVSARCMKVSGACLGGWGARARSDVGGWPDCCGSSSSRSLHGNHSLGLAAPAPCPPRPGCEESGTASSASTSASSSSRDRVLQQLPLELPVSHFHAFPCGVGAKGPECAQGCARKYVSDLRVCGCVCECLGRVCRVLMYAGALRGIWWLSGKPGTATLFP